MGKVFEIRYKKVMKPGKEPELVAHQHYTEANAKIDAKARSHETGRALLGEIDYETKRLYRVCEFVSGVQGKWENREDSAIPCLVILTAEDTKQETSTEVQPKSELTDEEKQERKELLAKIREEQNAKNNPPTRERKKAESSQSEKDNERKKELIGKGIDPLLAEVICKANVHEGSPNFKFLEKLWAGKVSYRDFLGMTPIKVEQAMLKLRALLIANETGKAIASGGSSKEIFYRLIDYKMDVEEEVV